VTGPTAGIKKQPTILIIEDDSAIADFLSIGMLQEGLTPDIVPDGNSGLIRFSQTNPSLVVLDILLPGMEGWEVCRRIRAQSDIPIIILTAKDETSDKLRGFELGADDYVVKPFGMDELIARIKALLRRRGYTTLKDEIRFENIILRNDSREVLRGDRTVNLTSKEFELLHLFLSNPRLVLSKSVITQRLWGNGGEFMGNVVEVNIAHLRAKLGPPNLIHNVHGIGYILRP